MNESLMIICYFSSFLINIFVFLFTKRKNSQRNLKYISFSVGFLGQELQSQQQQQERKQQKKT